VKPEAVALCGGFVLIRHARSIAGKCRVDTEPNVRLDCESGGFCAPQPDLFLSGEGHVDFALMGGFGFHQFTDNLDTEPTGDAIVKRLGDDFRADLDQRFIHDHEVAHLDFLGGVFAHARVDDELADRVLFLALLRGGDV